MNIIWISQKQASELIIFFNGWGMNEHAIRHLNCDAYDVLMLNNYSDDFQITEDLTSYHACYLVAWSMGVWAAAKVLRHHSIRFKKAIAINGTLNALSDKEGIPCAIFKGTLDAWSEKSRKQFHMRIMGGSRAYMEHKEVLGNRSIEDQKAELFWLYNQCMQQAGETLHFDSALIGRQDAVFTPDNQQHHWENKTVCSYLDMPHFPFLQFTSWNQILSL